MDPRKQRLLLEQADRKLRPFAGLHEHNVPTEGWIYTIRKALNMSLRQLANKLGVTPQAVKALERREKAGTITLQSLHDIAKSLDMRLVYALVPNDESLMDLVEKRAMEIAKEIVNRTSQSMKLEDQENPESRLMQAFNEKKNELKNEIPKFLWD